MDLCLWSNAEIVVSKHRELKNCMARYFNLMHPEITVHPADLLLSANSPYPMRSFSNFHIIWFYFKQWGIKSLFRLKPVRLERLEIAVEGIVLRRR